MPEYSAGTASIRIRPNADNFIRDLNAKLKGMKDPGFTVRVGAELGEARADTAEWREKEERQGVEVDVDADTAGASGHMKAWREEQEARPVVVNVRVDSSQAMAQMAGMRRQLESFGRSDVFRLNLGALGVAAVQPAVTGLAQVAGGLQQVASAALVVPGGIVAAGASISTLAVGLFGVKDAYEAMSKAAQSSGTDMASQARAAQSAQNSLRNAVVDETQARKDQARAYRDARQNLQDLNVEMRGGLIDESRALLEAKKAREDLATGNYSDYRDQALRIQEADQRVLEVRTRNAHVAEDLNDAQKKGVENSDAVVAANERVTRAQQQVAAAQDAVADSAGKQSAAQKGAADAMDQLSPNAKKFVQTLIDMKPAFADFRAAVSEPLLEGKSEEFKEFFGDMSPLIKSGMANIATAWNQNISAFFGAVSSPEGKGLIDRILGNTADAQSKLSAAMKPLVDGLGTLAAAGTDALPRLADALGSVSTRFANFITDADQDGRLEDWINEGISGMSSLGESVLNIGQAFTTITQAAGGGNSFLGWLESITEKFKTWLNSDEGQAKLLEFFREGKDRLAEWGDLLKEIPGAFKSLSDGVQPYIGTVIDLMRTLSSLIGDHPDLVMAVLTAYLTWKTVIPVVNGVQSGITLLGNTVTGLSTNFYTTRDNAKKAMADVDDTFKKAGKAGSGMSKFSGALAAIGGSGALGGVMGVLATVAIPAVVVALDKLNEAHDQAAARVDNLEARERNLESTLDRVSGKLTAQSRDQAIDAAQNYDTPGEAGGSIPGLSKGNAVRAARQLGIPEDVYADALVGNPDAVQKVRDILSKNNLIPELNANEKLSRTASQLEGLSSGTINQDLLVRALMGDQDAVKTYTDTIEKVRQSANGRGGQALDAISGGVSLTEIAKQLSPSGQASVLSGGALNRSLEAIPGAQEAVQERARANGGAYQLTAPGKGFFGNGATVSKGASDNEFEILAPSTPGLLAALQASSIPYEVGVDGKISAKVPLDSPYIEKYEKGGMVPGTGPRVAIVHGGELIIPRDKVPRFDRGGLVDQFGNPITAGAAPGPAAAGTGSPVLPTAPNPTTQPGNGGIGGIVSQVASGLQGTAGTLVSLGQGLASMSQTAAAGGPSFGDQLAGRAAQLPGLAGLFGSMAINDPAAQQQAMMNWSGQTLSYLANWGLGTASKAANVALVGNGSEGGLLGFFGLQNSILSPNNVYNQALQQSAQFAMSGPLNTLFGNGQQQQGGASGSITDPASLAGQYGVQLDDQMLAQLYGTSGDASLLQNMSPAAQRAIQYAQQHAVGQKYVYGGVGPGYDCSGIASSIYAAARGLPEGVRYFDTETDFEALGFLPGNEPGSLNIGVMRGGGGPNSHMAVTLPNGVNVESGGSHGTTSYGGDARSAASFPLQWHLPLPPGFAAGGPTPSSKGPGPTGGYMAEVHPNEFMISARGRATVPDSFLHALNTGKVDPKDLPSFAPGGPVPPPNAAIAPRPTPTPLPPRGPDIKQIVPRTTAPTSPGPTRTAAPAPSQATPQAPQTVTPQAPQTVAPQAPAAATSPAAQGALQQGRIMPTVAPAPSDLNHTPDWINTAIQSGASALGQALSTAIGLGGAAAGGLGGSALGAAGPYAAGLVQQFGKVTEKMVNVVSSSLVGNVGAFGDPSAPASGTTLRPDQNRPVTAPYGGNTYGNTYNTFNGYEAREVLQMQENNDSLRRQALMASTPVRG